MCWGWVLDVVGRGHIECSACSYHTIEKRTTGVAKLGGSSCIGNRVMSACVLSTTQSVFRVDFEYRDAKASPIIVNGGVVAASAGEEGVGHASSRTTPGRPMTAGLVSMGTNLESRLPVEYIVNIDMLSCRKTWYDIKI